MKTRLLPPFLRYPGLGKRLKVCAALLLWAPLLLAQPLKHVTLHFKSQKVTVQEAILEIRRTALVHVAYDEKSLVPGQQILLPAKELNGEALLQELNRQAGLEAKELNGTLYLKKIGKPAQQTEKVRISGTVTSAELGSMPGVFIMANGKVLTATDSDGKFSAEVAKGEEVQFSFVGYLTFRRVFSQSEANVVISLVQDSQQLSEVVVTALGIEREEKALGYSITKLEGGQITEALPNNWTEALSGRVAGLNLIRSGGGPAGSNRIILRGETNLNGSSEALIIIDGVVMAGSNRQTGTGSSAYLQSDSPVDFGSSLNDINPEDIETVTVLKGPGSAALYGARGADGAIIITTKSGRSRTKGIGVTFTSNTAFEQVSRWPDYQYEYGQGDAGMNHYSFLDTEDGTSTRSTSSAWGPRFDGQQFFQYDPVTRTTGASRTPWVADKNNRKDFFELGKTFTNSISLEGGTANTNVRLSLTNLQNTWIIPNTGYTRNTVALSASQKVTDKLQISTKINYTNKASDNLPSTGYNNQSLMYWLMFQVPNARLDWFKDYWVPGREGVQQSYPFSSLVDNPYLIANEMLNKSNRHQLTGNVQATYNFNKDLSLMVRSTLDYSYDARSQQRPKDTEKFKNGMFRTQNIFSQEVNNDFLLRYGRSFLEKFEASISVGGATLRNKYLRDELQANNLIFPQVFTLANSADVLRALPHREEYAINSMYGLGTFSYNEWLFLDVTGRQDWFSTLATPGFDRNVGVFYSSANVSTVLSEVIPMPAAISMVKLRASIAGVGSGGKDPYRTSYTYEPVPDFPGGLRNQTVIANPNLNHLFTRSLEFGADVRLFKGLLGVDVTVYRNNTYDQIFPVPIDRAAGANAVILNAGLVQNRGIEVQANGVPIRNWNGFTWYLFGTFTANRNKIIELADSVFTYQMQRGPGGRGLSVEARPGGAMGDIYGKGYVRSPDGQIVYQNGYPLISDDIQYLGNSMPKWRGSLGNEFQYKNFKFSFLLDGMFGAKAYSLTYAVLSEQGKTKNTLPGRYNGIIGNGVIRNGDGTYRPNDVVAENIASYYTAHFGRDNQEGAVFSTDFIKLRETRFDYTLPSALTQRLKLQKASIGVYGRDLFMLTNWPAFDPEFGTLNGANGSIEAGIEIGQFPATRTMGVTVTIGI